MPESTVKPSFYPFSAVYGAEHVQKALMCMMVNPRIKGVLITGPSGVAKTAISRSLSNETFGRSIVNIPIGITEEQLFGCLDIEAAIRDGSVSVQKGVMNLADGNCICMNDLNLFDRKTVVSLMNSVLDGRVTVEREGLSAAYGCDTSVIATVNTSDGFIDSRVLDYFDISVKMVFPQDPEGREEILARNLQFSEDPDGFSEKYAEQDISVSEKVKRARSLLPSVKMSDGMAELIAGITSSLYTEGYRGDISTANVSLTLAALDGRTSVTGDDVKEAAVLCLSHRIRKAVPEKKEKKKERDTEDNSFGNSHMKRFIHDERNVPKEDVPETRDGPDTESAQKPDETEIESVVFDIGETFRTVDILNGGSGTLRGPGRSGKRMFMLSDDRSGKYVRSGITEKKNPDLAFDATVRAAAPYQAERRSKPGSAEGSIIIEKQDLREKIRERRSSCTFLFLVDTSGSLIIRSRMIAVKGAIMSLLKDHYVRRDRVGFMTFNEKAIEMLLPPTRSVDCVYKLLDKLPVGERTPLGYAMIRADGFMRSYVKKHPHERCYIILVTDGKANIPVNEGADAVEESVKLAHTMDTPNTNWIVVDTNRKVGDKPYSKELAAALSAGYYSLDDIKSDL